jgi:hypothetical protein
MIQIKLLYFDGCPSWQPALENLKMAIAAEKIAAEISLVKIQTPQQAEQERFLGSPSFLVNGEDLWPEERSHYVLSCRVYQTPSGLKGSPSTEMLQERLKEVIQVTGSTAKRG